jgi:hypothetical protein
LIPTAPVSIPQPAPRAGRATVKSRQGLSSLPVAAQALVSATLGENDRRYQVAAVASTMRVQNPAQALQADFTRQGMDVRSGQTHWRLALVGYGYGVHLERVGEAAPHSLGNRVEYQRGPLVEWYVNGPTGLEQGFTLSAPPLLGTRETGHGIRDTGRGASAPSVTPDTGHRTLDSSPLTIALEIGGDLTATADSPAHEQGSARSEGLTLRDGHGQPVLRYTGLTAHDASGRALAAWLEVGRGELWLRVEDAGARYPVVVDPFVEQARLAASDGASGDELGTSVDVSSDGITLVAGAPCATIGSNAQQGAAYVFVMPASGWATTSTFTAKLTASDGAASDALGFSVGISSNGSTIVAGADQYNTAGPGAAYVFVRPARGWASATYPQTETAKLIAPDGVSGDSLGYDVGVSGDGTTIVAGAPFATVGSNISQGAAYVFVKPGGGWASAPYPQIATAKLKASDGAEYDTLGASVGVSSNGSTIVAGARGSHTEQGAAYVFVKPRGGWASATQTAELTASDGVGGDQLGTAVGVSNDSSTIVAGAPYATVSGNSDQGALYVFVKPGGGWRGDLDETAELTNTTTGASRDRLGGSVGVSSNGNTIVAGADGRNSNTGAVDIFVRPEGGWTTTSTYTTEVVATKASLGTDFGFAVRVDGDGFSMAVGEPYRDSEQGVAYVFLTAPVVTFTGVPESEPYQGTFNVASSTNSSTSPVYTSNGGCTNGGTTTYTMTSGTVGCYATVTWPADVNYASARLFQKTKASKIAPTVTFSGAPASEAYQGTFTVASTTDSSSSPVYTSGGACTNSGPLYTMTKGTGTCTLNVSWVADANYLRASLSQTTTASKVGQAISFTTKAPSSASINSTFPVAAESTSKLTVALTVDVVSKGVCSLGTPTTAGGVTSATVTMLRSAGTCTIDATQGGNGNYGPAAEQVTSATATP